MTVTKRNLLKRISLVALTIAILAFILKNFFADYIKAYRLYIGIVSFVACATYVVITAVELIKTRRR